MKRIVLLTITLCATVVFAQGVCPNDPNPRCKGPKCACTPGVVGDPVVMNSGASYHRVTDFEIQTGLGGFRFERLFTSSLSSWRISTNAGGYGTFQRWATPFGSSVFAGVRDNSFKSWHSLFAQVVAGSRVTVFDTDGVSHEYVTVLSPPPDGRFLEKHEFAGGLAESLWFDGQTYRLVKKDKTLVYTKWPTDAGCSWAGASCNHLAPLTAIEDTEGRALASIDYRFNTLPPECPATDAGIPIFPYINEVTLAGGLVLNFKHEYASTEGVFLNCRLTSISAGGAPLVEYFYSDAGLADPVEVRRRDGVEQLTYGASSFSVTESAVPLVEHDFGGGAQVTSLLGNGREPDRQLSYTNNQGPTSCTMCCLSGSIRRMVSTAGTLGNTGGGTGQLETLLWSGADYNIGGTHSVAVGETRDRCSGSPACSAGSTLYRWRGLVSQGTACNASNPAHPWAVQNKRGAVSLTKHAFGYVDGGAGLPLVKIPELYEVQRGANDLNGGGALETESRTYEYSAMRTQRLKTTATQSSLNASAQKVVQHNYTPFGSGLIETGVVTEGYTRDIDGQPVLERRGTF